MARRRSEAEIQNELKRRLEEIEVLKQQALQRGLAFTSPSEEELALFPTRVVSLGDSRSAYSFTMFKAPGMADELFESQYESLRREFDNIRARFATDHASCAQ